MTEPTVVSFSASSSGISAPNSSSKAIMSSTEGVGGEVVDEGGFRNHLSGVHAKLINDDVFDFLFEGHVLYSLGCLDSRPQPESG